MKLIRVETSELDLFLGNLGNRLSIIGLMDEIGFSSYRKAEDAIITLRELGYEVSNYDWLDSIYESEYSEYIEEILNYILGTHIYYYEGGDEMVYIGIPALGSGEYLEWNHNRFVELVNNSNPDHDQFQLVTDFSTWLDQVYNDDLD